MIVVSNCLVSLFSSIAMRTCSFEERGSLDILSTLSLILSMGPRARSFASFEKKSPPAVRIRQMSIVIVKERAAEST